MALPNPGMVFTPFDPLPASDLNDIVENIESIYFNPDTGWQPITDIWTYSAWDNTNKIATINVPSDATARYSVGMKLKFTQSTGGTKYGRITEVVSATQLKAYLVSGTLENEAITAPAYSVVEQPFGYPPAYMLANSTVRLASVTRAGTQNVTSIGSNVELTGTSITFTIPEGGRDVEIVHYVSHTQPTGGTIVEYRVWDGSVNGTQIGGATHKYNDAGHAKPLNIFTILSAPAAGTKTIKISAHTNTNNINIYGYSIAPITVSAKLI